MPYQPNIRHRGAFSLVGIVLLLTIVVIPVVSARGQATDQRPANAVTAAAGDPAPQSSFGGELIDKIKEAREIGAVLILLSVMGIGFVIERAVNVRRRSICPEGLASNVLDHLRGGRLEQAKAACEASPGAMASVLSAIVRHHRFSFADMNLIAGDVATREIQSHIQRCYPIAVIAGIAPLLGLLGTVLGMIEAFEKIALMGEMSDPSVMASSISYALVTTAMGLIIAAPGLVFYRYFRIRISKLSARMDEEVSEVISGWHEHQLEQVGAARAPKVQVNHHGARPDDQPHAPAAHEVAR